MPDPTVDPTLSPYIAAPSPDAASSMGFALPDSMSPINSNPLTPNTGPVPPAQIQSAIPSWFNPTSWLQTIGGIPGSIEAWWSGTPLNPANAYQAGINAGSAIWTDISDAGQTVMSKVTVPVSNAVTALSAGLSNATNFVKWLAILGIVALAIYFLSQIKGVANLFKKS